MSRASDAFRARYHAQAIKDAERFSESLSRSLDDNLFAFCESPIELILAEAIALKWFPAVAFPKVFIPQHDRRPTGLEDFWQRFNAEMRAFPFGYIGDRLALCPQLTLGQYRADFVVLAFDEIWQHRASVAVECDGHDYHERTKDQAERDRSRDRAMQAQGLMVLRFTGSEIVRDADRCAEEIREAIWKQRIQTMRAAASADPSKGDR